MVLLFIAYFKIIYKMTSQDINNVQLGKLSVSLSDIKLKQCSEDCGCCNAPDNNSARKDSSENISYDEEDEMPLKRLSISLCDVGAQLGSSSINSHSLSRCTDTLQLSPVNEKQRRSSLTMVTEDTYIDQKQKAKSYSTEEKNYHEVADTPPQKQKKNSGEDSDSEEIKSNSSRGRNYKVSETRPRKESKENKKLNFSSNEDSDLEEVQTQSSDIVNDSRREENIQLKRCSVVLHDIGSKLHSDIININDISKLSTNDEKRINDDVKSSLNKKKLVKYKSKVKTWSSYSVNYSKEDDNAQLKRCSVVLNDLGPQLCSHITKNYDVDLLLPSNDHGGINVTSDESELVDYKSKKSNFKSVKCGKEEEVLSEKQIRTEKLFSSSSEEEFDLEEIKSVCSKVLDCDPVDGIQLKTCSVLLHDIKFDPSLSMKIKYTDYSKKGRKCILRDESMEKHSESDNSSKELFKDDESLDSENEVKNKSKKLKSKKKVTHISSDDSVYPKKKRQRKSCVSVTSDEDDKEENNKSLVTKRKEKLKKRNLPRRQELVQNGKEGKELRKKQVVKYYKSSESEESDASEKEKKLATKSKSYESITDSDRSFKESLTSKKSTDSEGKKESKNAKKLTPEKIVESDLSDDFVVLNEKKRRKSSISDDNDDGGKKEDEKRSLRKRESRKKTSPSKYEINELLPKRRKRKHLRERQKIKYCESSDSEEDASEKEKSLTSEDENSNKSTDSERKEKESLKDNQPLDSEGKKESKNAKKLTPEKIVESDLSDDFVVLNEKKRRKSSISDDNDDGGKKEDEKRSLRKRESRKKTLPSRNEISIFTTKRSRRQLRERQKIKYCESSDSEEDASEKHESGNKKYSTSEKDDKDDSDFDVNNDDEHGNEKYSSSEKDDKDDSDFDSNNYKRKSSSKNNINMMKMSEYERQMVEKRAKNLEFLISLGIQQVKKDLLDVVTSQKTMKEMQKKAKSSNKSTVPVIKRTSKRQKEPIYYCEEENLFMSNVLPPHEKLKKFKQITFRQALQSSFYESFVHDFAEVLKKDSSCKHTPVLYDKDDLKQLSQKAETLRFHSPSASSWYPCSENLVLAAGESYGMLNFLNIKESSCDIHRFQIQSRKITNLQFCPHNSSHLISSSADGSLLNCDIQEQTFTEILRLSDEGCTDFDFFSPTCCLVSSTTGKIIIIDQRARRPNYIQKSHVSHDSYIYAINMHPVNKNYYVTAGKDSAFRIWDLRRLSGKPLIENRYHRKGVYSASFSPVTGKFLLTASYDESLCIFDCENMTEGSIHCHRNMQYIGGRRIEIKPVWLPNSNETFVFCFERYLNEFPIYDKDLNICEKISDKKKSLRVGIKKLITFHPCKTAYSCVFSPNRMVIYA